MARPKKQTVDYFPHTATSGKTMFTLETRFENTGYAFWFKTLELLASTEKHVFDCRNSANWEFLLAKTRTDEVTASSILDLLARLDAIDPELWSYKVIWSQNFVDNIADVYKNRKSAPPVRPSLESFYEQEPSHGVVTTSRNEVEQELSSQATNENPQSKVKETKVKETKVNNTIILDDEVKNNFRKLWDLYPKKTNQYESFEFYKLAIEKGTTNKEIQTGIVNYVKYLQMNKTELRYVKTDVNFFRDKFWQNHQTEPVAKYGQKSEVIPDWMKQQELEQAAEISEVTEVSNESVDAGAEALRKRMEALGLGGNDD